MIKLNAKQLRNKTPLLGQSLPYSFPVVLIVDNVQDTYNIGSFFRLADALGWQKIYLCGRTVLPPNVKVHRSSVGLWRWMPWEHRSSTLGLVKELKKQSFSIIAIEQDQRSINYRKIRPKYPLALVVGHETDGVEKPVLKMADVVAEIPLLGVNRSLNVLVAAAVVGYHLGSFPPPKAKRS